LELRKNQVRDDGLLVDGLSMTAFNVTVKEVSKAVGVSKKAFKVSAARTERVIQEVQEQIGRVMAEKVDADLLTAMTSSYTQGFLATDATGVMNITNMNIGKIVAFGDKHKDSVVCFMHSCSSST
jgi:phosphoglucomutase